MFFYSRLEEQKNAFTPQTIFLKPSAVTARLLG